VTVTCSPPFALTPALAFPEMTRVAALPAPRVPGAVLMPLIIDDAFFDGVGGSLPARSLSFLLPAASWSARNSKSGFVPSWQVAKLSDDPDRDVGTLQSVGIARRVKGGGMQIAEGKGIVIVNADAAAAEAERRREQGRLRAQRKRDRDKGARTAAMAHGVTPASRGQSPGVTRTERREEKKQQVSDESVTRYETGSSRVTAENNASDNQGLDQDQSIWGSQVDACPREAWPAEVVTAAVTDASKKAGRAVTEAEALRAVAVFDARARKRGKVVHDRVQFNATCFTRERNIEAILAPSPAPEWLDLGTAPEPPSGAHPYEQDPAQPFIDSCVRPGCGVRRSNARHVNQKAVNE
jgi:hypothetical protein